MKTINTIISFEDNKYFLAMLKGYCHASHIVMAECSFTIKEINDIEKLKPALIIVPVTLLNAANKRLETALLMQKVANNQFKVCGLNKKPTDTIKADVPRYTDVIINDPFDISKIDAYIKNNFLVGHVFVEKRTNQERRSFAERRSRELNALVGKIDSPEHRNGTGLKNFRVDRRNKCVFIKGVKVDLTPKEFELIELLSTDSNRIFTTDEIIAYLWPDNNRATKSDLYQYMHLLRKKIERDPNHPQWLMNIKGFGYRLNNSDDSENTTPSPEPGKNGTTILHVVSG
ncbi:MAG: winged helix-turn-helix domain-containing protein [Methylococcales bacterium]